MDEDALHDALDRASDRHVARQRGAELRTLRGVRGVPITELAKIIDAAWSEGVDLDDDAGVLDRLFGSAFEDGMVAIGLVAAALPDAPDAAWDLAQGWLSRVDDTTTADNLGWLVLGPSLLATGQHPDALAADGPASPRSGHAAARRAATAAALAFLPEPIEGPAAAALRARMGQRQVQFVSEPLSDHLASVATTRFRDEDPGVRKAVRRLLRVWTDWDPAACADWGESMKGGMHKMLGEEVKRARRKAGAE
jgi:hypothetical protein